MHFPERRGRWCHFGSGPHTHDPPLSARRNIFWVARRSSVVRMEISCGEKWGRAVEASRNRALEKVKPTSRLLLPPIPPMTASKNITLSSRIYSRIVICVLLVFVISLVMAIMSAIVIPRPAPDPRTQQVEGIAGAVAALCFAVAWIVSLCVAMGVLAAVWVVGRRHPTSRRQTTKRA